MNKKKIFIGLVVLSVIIIAGAIAFKLTSPKTETKVGLPNPASVHCEEVGGTLDIRTDASGGQVGYCVFPDKTECEEWALLRNECTDTTPVTKTENTNADKFRNLNIKEGETITSPLKITGEARGSWFFEASFPVSLVDWDGRIIGEGLAQTKEDWMNNNFLPFEATITFTKPANPTNQDYARRGAIIFKKDNPSGLSKYEAAYEMPISF